MSEIRVGILGLGTIGIGAARILIEQQELMSRRLGKTVRLVAAADRVLDRDFGLDMSGVRLTDDANDVVTADDVDLVIELIGGYEPARTFVATAIEHGKHVMIMNAELDGTVGKRGDHMWFLAPLAGETLLCGWITVRILQAFNVST